MCEIYLWILKIPLKLIENEKKGTVGGSLII